MNLVSKIIYRIQLRKYKIGSWGYLAILLKLLNSKDVNIDKGQINLKKLNLNITKDKFTYLLAAYDHAALLSEQEGVFFKIESDKLFINFEKLKFEIQTSEEIFILREIFVDGVYNFNTVNPIQDYVVIDIGMNVAFASCYFVVEKKASKIISFEPFKPTYNQALTNISLNQLENKIEVHDFGLGGCDEILEVEYSPEFRGQVGMQGIDSIKSKINQSQIEKIEIKNAFPILEKIYSENTDSKFILKIDCEGAEYDLIDRIPQSFLKNTEVIMMEWHNKGPKIIENWLSKSGFSSMSFNPLSNRVGMIYAIKN